MSYAPEPTGIGPYTAGLAEMLVRRGAAVDVIAGIPHYPTWRVRAEDRWRLRQRETRNGVAIRRARHYVPRRQSALTRALWEGTFLLNAGLMRLAAAPDVVVAVSPSLSSAAVGARLAARHDVPFAVVVQDLVGQAALQSGVSGGGTVAGATARLEASVLRRADLVAVCSDTFRRQLLDYGVAADRIRLLPNWSHIDRPQGDRAETRRRLGWSDDAFVVLHTGNMGLKQDLDNVIEAARLVGRADPNVLVVLMGDGNQRAHLEAAGADVPNLRFMDPAGDEDYPDTLRAADLLLVNERPTVGEMSLPSKLTSYFSVGRPVLAAVADDGACARELAATGGAAHRVDAGQPQMLAAAMSTLRQQPEVLAAMGEAGADYAERTLGQAAAARRVSDLATELVLLHEKTRTMVGLASPRPVIDRAGDRASMAPAE
jgi:glycosyltransferase involved in cell wall biosynthesis